MRISIKKKPTERAMKMVLNKLDRLSQKDDEKILILEQSILKNWTDVYEVQNQQVRGYNNARISSTHGDYDSSGRQLL